ncbi:hypothetical protein SJI45_18970 [Streptomyces sp. S399]|uniref:hypothetical protein n=1 Tax=Streptomyces sp. S399 TaxID=3096009 RepID=UPI002A81FC75|nr:hypothetical protein [Streptomyces sp. S399]WPR52819.1 hypothetical protein SJI45_18970 [Streptomyces sp. S399]
MFAETVLHSGGITEGHASEAHAAHLIRRALHRGYTVTPTPDGGACITWTARRLGSGSLIEEPRSVVLTPHTPAGHLHASVRTALHAIARSADAHADLDKQDRPRIRLSADAEPVDVRTTSRLYGCRLVTEERGRVRLTLTATLALLAAHGADREDLAAVFLPAPTAVAA